jgi:DNA-binding transcriptional LysR family regulator
MRPRVLRSLDPLSLHLLEAAVRRGSIAKAAEEHAIAASAVSRRLAELEAALGRPLLERGARGVRPTPAGEAALRFARGTVELADRLTSDLDDIEAGRAGELTVAAVTSAVLGRLPDDLRRLRAARPQLRIAVVEVSSSTEGTRLVLDGDADIGVVADVEAQGFDRRFYARDPIRIVAAADHPIALSAGADDVVGFAEALKHEVIAIGGGVAIDAIVRAAADVGEGGMRRTLEVKTFGALIRLVEAGLGIGFLRESGARFLGTNHAVRMLRLREPWAERDLVLIRRRGAAPTQAVAAFLEIAEQSR